MRLGDNPGTEERSQGREAGVQVNLRLVPIFPRETYVLFQVLGSSVYSEPCVVIFSSSGCALYNLLIDDLIYNKAQGNLG